MRAKPQIPFGLIVVVFGVLLLAGVQGGSDGVIDLVVRLFKLVAAVVVGGIVLMVLGSGARY